MKCCGIEMESEDCYEDDIPARLYLCLTCGREILWSLNREIHVCSEGDRAVTYYRRYPTSLYIGDK